MEAGSYFLRCVALLGNKGIVAAGCYNGQVILWNVEEAKKQIMEQRALIDEEDQNSEETFIPSIAPSMVSSIDKSHSMCITDLVWLPAGVEVSKEGKVSIGKDESNFFTTTSVDGRVLFWDMRLAQQKKPGPKEGAEGGSGENANGKSSSSGGAESGRRRGKETSNRSQRRRTYWS